MKQILNNGKNIPFRNNYFSATCFVSTVNDLPVDEYINSTDDLTFELVDNSKIEVYLIDEKPLDYENFTYALPNIELK